jgi:hypothetical protein
VLATPAFPTSSIGAVPFGREHVERFSRDQIAGIGAIGFQKRRRQLRRLIPLLTRKAPEEVASVPGLIDPLNEVILDPAIWECYRDLLGALDREAACANHRDQSIRIRQ